MTNEQESEEVRLFKATKIKAEQGDAKAQAVLGRMYYAGKGVRKNRKVAAKWYEKAAEQGNEYAQWNLGLMYAKGEGVERDKKDYKEAAKRLRKAAEQGYAWAQYFLGLMYAEGEDVERYKKDYKKAAKWFRKAAEADHQGYATEAQYKLGEMYYYGCGVPKDNVEAVKWFRKAAEQGHAGAQYRLGEMHYRGVPDYKKAAKWYRKAVKQGSLATLHRLGRMYCHPFLSSGTIIDVSLNALYELGRMYRRGGEGVPKDDEEEAKWWRKAAEQGDADAQINLASMYYCGDGMPKNFIEAYAWSLLAIANGNEKVREMFSVLEKNFTVKQGKKAQARAAELRRLIEERKENPKPSIESP